MRSVIIAVLLVCSACSSLSCGTAYRYEYYDASDKTVDEKNQEKVNSIDRKYRGFIPSSGGRYR